MRGWRLYLGVAIIGITSMGLTPTPARASNPEEICPKKTSRRDPKMYMIGASTMGSVLGPMLKREVRKRWNMEARFWGKASTGLARPDFHDWIRRAPGLMARHRPDVVLVSLGSNDNQPLFDKRKGWIRMKSPAWKTMYAKRVQRFLEKLSGEDRKRPIIWMGPMAIKGRNAAKMGSVIDRISKEVVEAFDGPAVFIDIRTRTLDSNGEPITKFKVPGEDSKRSARAKDGIHLKIAGVRWLLAEPVLNLLKPCFDSQDTSDIDVNKPPKSIERPDANESDTLVGDDRPPLSEETSTTL